MIALLRRKRKSGDSANQPATEIGRRAKRLTNWSINLLVTGLIVVIGLTFGKQAIQWWGTDAPTDAIQHEVVPTDLGKEDAAQLLSFGDLPFAFVQRRLSGDKAAAFAELRTICARSAKDGAAPPGNAGPAETKMLARLPKMKPAGGVPGQWAVYQLDGPLLMVAVVRPPPSETGQVAAAAPRVVSWGLGVPQGDDEWTLFVYSADRQQAGPRPATASLPTPPNSRRSMSLSTEDGAALIGFVGSGQISDWREFYTDWFDDHGWSVEAAWRRHSSQWLGRFGNPESRVEIQISPQQDYLTGMITITPRHHQSGD